MPKPKHDTTDVSDDTTGTTLVTVRIPTRDLESLRLAALVRGGSIAHEVRSGVQLRLAQLRRDPDFVEQIRKQRDALSAFVDDLADARQTHQQSHNPEQTEAPDDGAVVRSDALRPGSR